MRIDMSHTKKPLRLPTILLDPIRTILISQHIVCPQFIISLQMFAMEFVTQNCPTFVYQKKNKEEKNFQFKFLLHKSYLILCMARSVKGIIYTTIHTLMCPPNRIFFFFLLKFNIPFQEKQYVYSHRPKSYQLPAYFHFTFCNASPYMYVHIFINAHTKYIFYEYLPPLTY